MSQEKRDEPVAQAPAKHDPRRKSLMVGGILLGVMIAEGLIVFVLAKHFGLQPATARAGGIGGLDPAEGDRAPEECEIEVARFRAQNEQARQLVVYDLTVYAIVSKTGQTRFKELIDRKNAAIQDRFSSVIRAADPQVLMEPDPATLRQQFRRELGQIVGDEETVLGILIPSIVAYREN